MELQVALDSFMAGFDESEASASNSPMPMPNPLDSGFWGVRTAGEGVSIKAAKHARAEALQVAISEFAAELVCWSGVSVVATDVAITDKYRNQRALHPAHVRTMTTTYVGFADIRSRCNVLGTNIMSAPSSKSIPPQKTLEFDEALSCYRPDECIDQEVLSKMRYILPEDAYGTSKNLDQLQQGAIQQFDNVRDQNISLLDLLRGTEQTRMSTSVVRVNSYSDALRMIHFVTGDPKNADIPPTGDRDAISWARSQLLHRLQLRIVAHRNARSTLSEIVRIVNIVRSERLKKQQGLMDMLSTDVQSSIFEKLSSADVVSMMGSCKAFRASETLRKQLPGPRVRVVMAIANEDGTEPGPFPHARYGIGGVQKAYVCSNIKCRIFVDFVQRCQHVQKKKPGVHATLSDMLASGAELNHDAEKDKKDKTDRPAHLVLQDKDKALVKPMSKRQLRAAIADTSDKERDKIFRLNRLYNLEGPKERRDPAYNFTRLRHDKFFDEMPRYTIVLVFSESLEEVPSLTAAPNIAPIDKELFQGSFSCGDVQKSIEKLNISEAETDFLIHKDTKAPFPAFTEFRVSCLSSNQLDPMQEFRLRVTTHAVKNGQSYRIVSFSESFLCVSKLKVAVARSGEKRKDR
ncbi:MAG: hypothetical protein ACKVI4_13600 [Actinomycetales bacterium]|tara:strand:- start:2640 stop:4535 length:1896 start_codon:yes stop_codon:yes gene_type:complete